MQTMTRQYPSRMMIYFVHVHLTITQKWRRTFTRCRTRPSSLTLSKSSILQQKILDLKTSQWPPDPLIIKVVGVVSFGGKTKSESTSQLAPKYVVIPPVIRTSFPWEVTSFVQLNQSTIIKEFHLSIYLGLSLY
mmetsp:Transcript_7862/g.10783  ORF Transcript_7862/g.10783 Transcript_7862/m.10783 type:complete len:134 (-) Transcript_7862:1075-1476(-)